MKFSIITINYNNAEGLRQTLESVVAQTCRDFEHIVIDGGSTDGSVELIHQYASHISYWVSEPDHGVYHAMNKGIRVASGEYLNFMNSGDCFHSPRVLEEVAPEVEGCDILLGRYCNRDTQEVKQVRRGPVTLLTLLKEPFNHQSMFYARSLFAEQQYDESLRIQSDFKFNVLSIVFGHCRVAFTDVIVADYDFHGISSNVPLVREEKEVVLQQLFPQRVLDDYRYLYTPEEVPLVTLLPELKRYPRIQHLLYRLAKWLLSLKTRPQ